MTKKSNCGDTRILNLGPEKFLFSINRWRAKSNQKKAQISILILRLKKSFLIKWIWAESQCIVFQPIDNKMFNIDLQNIRNMSYFILRLIFCYLKTGFHEMKDNKHKKFGETMEFPLPQRTSVCRKARRKLNDLGFKQSLPFSSLA